MSRESLIDELVSFISSNYNQPSMWEEFSKDHAKLCSVLSEDQIDSLKEYYHSLIEWNSKMNLTRITSEQDYLLKHCLDTSLLLQAYLRHFGVEVPKRYLDFGTGGGVPGVVLWIYFQKRPELHLMDARNKKLLAIAEMFSKSKWTMPVCHHQNLKENQVKKLLKSLGFHFDLVTARAVGPTDVLLKTLLPLTGKSLILPKGPNLDSGEWELAQQIAKKYNFLASCKDTHLDFQGTSIERKLLVFVAND